MRANIFGKFCCESATGSLRSHILNGPSHRFLFISPFSSDTNLTILNLTSYSMKVILSWFCRRNAL